MGAGGETGWGTAFLRPLLSGRDAGTMTGTGNGGESLVWWGKWADQQTFITWRDQCQERGTEPGGDGQVVTTT